MNGSSSVSPLERNAMRLGSAVLVGGFILALLPLAGNYIMYYPDERHYSDGGLGMLSDGQWLWPRSSLFRTSFKRWLNCKYLIQRWL